MSLWKLTHDTEPESHDAANPYTPYEMIAVAKFFQCRTKYDYRKGLLREHYDSAGPDWVVVPQSQIDTILKGTP